eukprot:4114265-Pleurochrysis_carterae.AAC.1
MVDAVDEHTTTVLDIFRERISKSGDDDRLSILSPVLPNIVTKMTETGKHMNMMLGIIESVCGDKRDDMLPGILLVGSALDELVNFQDKEKNWRFFYYKHTAQLGVFSHFMSPPVESKAIRVRSVHDVHAMEIFLREQSVPEAYIESIASVLREHFEWRDNNIRNADMSSSSSTTQSTAGFLSLAGHVVRHLLCEHIDELDESDVLNLVDVEVLRKILVQFMKQDRMANVVR